jgi:alginate O-acetyltransferase complex protein AlgI
MLAASYVFYSAWDWRFSGLLLAISVVDWCCGLGIHRTAKHWKQVLFLTSSILFDLGVLVYFKYANFFLQNFARFWHFVSPAPDWPTLNVILPVGISFIVFKSMSYTIDVYRREVPVEKEFMTYALFVSFFPDLVAGPIIRARTVLAQLHSPRVLTQKMLTEGVWLILIGFFLKLVVADNLSGIVNSVFSESHVDSGVHALLGVYGFAFQILGDFSGYSSIAIGIARTLGFKLPPNFAHPYLVGNPQEFWRHWHISLSTWLRDYVYFSLGGNRNGPTKTYRNLIVTMLLGGLWHGAAWTFVIWGLYHGILLTVHRALSGIMPRIVGQRTQVSRVWRVAAVLGTFQLTCMGWLLFRASSLAQVHNFLLSLGTAPDPRAWNELAPNFAVLGLLAAAVLIVDQAIRQESGEIVPLRVSSRIRWALAAALCYSILVFGDFGLQQFIYFQF